MKEKFLSELLSEEIFDVPNGVHVITAPTGLGKTTFILERLVPHYANYEALSKRQVLILCNRKLLRLQYWNALISRTQRFQTIADTVMLMTYQELACAIQYRQSVDAFFQQFCAVVCDEVHYFYADADFNSLGTFPVLHAVVRAAASLPVFMFSATTLELMPLLEDAVDAQNSILCHAKLQTINPAAYSIRTLNSINRCLSWIRITKYDYTHLADYERFECYAVPDIETMSCALAKNEGKSVVFVDQIKVADELAVELEKHGVSKNDLAALNAANIDNECLRHIIDPLVTTGSLTVKVLLTTAVLDNGVSIHDRDVNTIAIITESKTSFLQMLGRVRADDKNKKISLLFLLRDASVFRDRSKRCKQEMAAIQDIEQNPSAYSGLGIIRAFWDKNANMQHELFRTIFVPMREDVDFLPSDNRKTVNADGISISLRYGTSTFFINRFAIEKIGNTCISEENFYHAALRDPYKVIHQQMGWIGKEPKELAKLHSVLKDEFLNYLLSINNASIPELKEIKRTLNKKYRLLFFADIVDKAGSFNTSTLRQIAEREGLQLIEEKDADRRKHITITRRDSDLTQASDNTALQ